MQPDTFKKYTQILRKIERHLDVVGGGSTEFFKCFNGAFEDYSDGTSLFPHLHKTYYYLSKPFALLQAIDGGCNRLSIRRVHLDDYDSFINATGMIASGLISNILNTQGRDSSLPIYSYVVHNGNNTDNFGQYFEFVVCYFVYPDGQDKTSRNERRASYIELNEAMAKPAENNNKKRGWL